jgi:hypothetical protein
MGVSEVVFTGTLDECVSFCEAHTGTFIDSNGFAWDLEIEDADASPEGQGGHYGI